MRDCPACGSSNAGDARFCASCGASLGQRCEACGAELPDGAAFCPSCGAPVIQPEISGVDERKLVTVLFADVTGSTSLGEQLDPEQLRDVLDTYFRAMRDEIEAEGGTVEKFIGDAVMAAFGVPVAHEDDPARALRAAQRMLERLAAVNDDLAERHDVRLQIRIGVNTGEVLATTAPRPGEPMVTGDIVNAAARLQSLAEPGTIVLGDRTARSVPAAGLEDLGALELKGKYARVHAYRLSGIGGTSERGVPGLRAPMVGRDAEMDVLRSVFGRVAAERRPSLVTIYGDAGVGKSRLTREFLTWAEGADPAPLVLRGRCLPYGDGIVYWPLAEIVKGHAGILDSDGADVASEKLRKLGLDLLTPAVTADPEMAIAALAYSVGLPDPDGRLDDLEPQSVHEEVQAAWRSFFSAVAADRPAVVVIEDIHWADPVLLDLLEGLADRVEGPVMFLCPSRPDLTSRRPTWGGGRRSMSAVALDPLTVDQAERLVELLLAVDDLPASVRATMIERAEGNPFFLEEIIRRLIDDGSIVRTGERWRAAASITEVDIPDTVQAVLASRIDLLEPADKRALQMAAVVGRVFWAGPVARLTDRRRDEVGEALRRLEDRELVLSRAGSTIEGEREHLFKHILTRDVAYESLPRRDRAVAHREVAAWIEEAAGTRVEEFAELLVYHASTAVRTTRELGEVPDDELRRLALRWALTASVSARRRAVMAKAERLAEAALELAVTDAERTDALEALAEAENGLIQGDLAWRYFLEAIDACERVEPYDGLRVADLCARACELPQRFPGSMHNPPEEADVLAVVERGFAALPDGDSKPRVQLLGLRAGWAFAYPDDERTDVDLEALEAAGIQAAETAIRLGLPNLASSAYDQANGGWISRGRYDRAERTWRMRRDIMPQVTSVLEIGDFYAMGAWIATGQGRYEEAIDLADEGVRQVGDRGPNVTIHNRCWKVQCYKRLGRWDEALAEVAIVRALLEDRQDLPPGFASAAYAIAGAIHARQGERIDSDRLAQIVDRIPGERAVRLYPDLVEMDIARGDVGAARARPIPFGWQTAGGDTLVARARMIAAAQTWEEAPALLSEMRAMAGASPWPELDAEVVRLEGRIALASDDRATGMGRLEAAAAAFEALGCVWELAVTDLELAEAGAPDATQRAAAAAATFERLRTRAHLSRARAVT